LHYRNYQQESQWICARRLVFVGVKQIQAIENKEFCSEKKRGAQTCDVVSRIRSDPAGLSFLRNFGKYAMRFGYSTRTGSCYASVNVVFTQKINRLPEMSWTWQMACLL
jgi:hypothetical protein